MNASRTIWIASSWSTKTSRWRRRSGCVTSSRPCAAEKFDLVLKLYFWLGVKPASSYWDERTGTDANKISDRDYWQAHERSIQLACSLGGRQTVGFADAEASSPPSFYSLPFALDRPVPENFLGIAALLGIPSHGSHLEFPLSRADRDAARALVGARQ